MSSAREKRQPDNAGKESSHDPHQGGTFPRKPFTPALVIGIETRGGWVGDRNPSMGTSRCGLRMVETMAPFTDNR